MKTSHKFIDVSVVAAAAASFNNWLLGIFLNRRLVSAGGSVSELSADNQPYHIVFRTLDVTSGVLFVIAALLFLLVLTKTRLNKALVLCMAIFGLANALDALMSLPCAETLDRGCSVPLSLSIHHLMIPSHAYTSTIIGLCYLVLPFLGLLYAKRLQIKKLVYSSIFTLAVAMISSISVVVGYIADGGPTVRAWGPSQEIQMIILASWFIHLSITIANKKLANP